jgi:hypothetical protein
MNPDSNPHTAATGSETEMPFEPVQPQRERPFESEPVSAKFVDSGPEPARFLFVQNAQFASTHDGTLTLHQVSPDTAYFSDRPHRVAGKVSTEEWVNRWGSGEDSFASDPPNATLSCQDGSQVVEAVVELNSPRLANNKLSYRVLALDGELPRSCEAARLFIDGSACLWCIP